MASTEGAVLFSVALLHERAFDVRNPPGKRDVSALYGPNGIAVCTHPHSLAQTVPPFTLILTR